jgi:Family of unknown function (DUF5681)
MAMTKTSWQKGRSGNPRGRPRAGEELGALLRQTIDRKRFAEKLCELCYAGDVQAMRLLLAYTDGPPVGRPDSDSTEEVQIVVSYVKRKNRFRANGTTPDATESNPMCETIQRGLLRAPLGQNDAGNGSVDKRGVAG